MFAGGSLQASTQTPRMEPLTHLMQVAGIIGMPVVLHCDIDNLHDQVHEFNEARGKGKGKQAERASRPTWTACARCSPTRAWQDTKTSGAHGGGLGRFVQEGAGHLDKLKQLLADCPNLNLDISWSEVAKQIGKNPESIKQWQGFIQDHSHRICFGSDTLAPKANTNWNETKRMYDDGLFKGMTPEAKHNVLNGTYERVFTQSRKDVRWFEQNVLTKDFVESHVTNNGGDAVSAATLMRAKGPCQGARRAAEADA